MADSQVTCIDHGWYRSDGAPCPECPTPAARIAAAVVKRSGLDQLADQTTSDRLNEIRENGRSFGGGPDRGEWEWLLRLADVADELAKAASVPIPATPETEDFWFDLRVALTRYQEVRRG